MQKKQITHKHIENHVKRKNNISFLIYSHFVSIFYKPTNATYTHAIYSYVYSLLNDAATIWSYIITWMGQNWNNFLFQFDYYTGIYLERMRNAMANITQDVLCLGKYLTSVPPQHNLEALALYTPRHVGPLNFQLWSIYTIVYCTSISTCS
jgi:hypothetical protein